MTRDPASLLIQRYPADSLRAKAAPVPKIDDEVRAVAQRMIELLDLAEGIGLAAPQVGLSWRLFISYVQEGENRSINDSPPTAQASPRVYINPVFSDFSRDLEPFEEGCLSLPGITGDVRRPTQATVTALDLDGNEFTETGAGLLARCWQHENDHLDGVLIIDRMTMRSRMKNRSAIRDLEAGAKIA